MIRILYVLIAALVIGSCGDDDDTAAGKDAGADGDADSDTDTDGDADTDTDADSDTDADTDSDTDTELDAGSGTDTDSSSESEKDSETETWFEVPDECDHREPWIARCDEAENEEDCVETGGSLPSLHKLCSYDDAWHTCVWTRTVSVAVAADAGCDFGETRSFCLYIGGGEEGPNRNASPCTSSFDMSQPFRYSWNGQTHVGHCEGYPTGLKDEPDYKLCKSPETKTNTCGCICDETYPLKDW